MRVTQASFVTSAAGPEGYPPGDLPEVAFVGRSNVGKSTLINTLLNRKGLAKTSQTPGKTQLINYFLVNGVFHLVDLPGYGYARVPAAEKARWQGRIEGYLQASDRLVLVVALVDIRHPPSEKDLQMLAWLRHCGRPHLVVATKADKLSRAKAHQALQQLAKSTGTVPLAVAAQKGTGLPDVWRAINGALQSDLP